MNVVTVPEYAWTRLPDTRYEVLVQGDGGNVTIDYDVADAGMCQDKVKVTIQTLGMSIRAYPLRDGEPGEPIGSCALRRSGDNPSQVLLLVRRARADS